MLYGECDDGSDADDTCLVGTWRGGPHQAKADGAFDRATMKDCSAERRTIEHSPTPEGARQRPRRDLARWRKRLFAFLARRQTPAIRHFHLPPGRVVEVDEEIEL